MNCIKCINKTILFIILFFGFYAKAGEYQTRLDSLLAPNLKDPKIRTLFKNCYYKRGFFYCISYDWEGEVCHTVSSEYYHKTVCKKNKEGLEDGQEKSSN